MNYIKRFFLFTSILISHQTFSTPEQGKAIIFEYSLPKHKNVMQIFGKLNPHTMNLTEIEIAITTHIAKRNIYNWWFTSIQVHNATLQAIHAYKSLSPEDQNKKEIQQSLQNIFDSHALFLFHPLYWTTRKHVSLVDAFIYATTGKRYEISRLDGIADRINVSGVSTPVIIPSSRNSTQSSTQSNRK